MNRKLLLGIAVALAVGAYFVPWHKTGDPTAQPGTRELYTVRRADLNITLTESGRLVAKESTKVKAQIKGEGKITFLVEEGKEVREGDIVCKLDPTQAQNQVEESQLEILQTEQNLKTARTNSRSNRSRTRPPSPNPWSHSTAPNRSSSSTATAKRRRSAASSKWRSRTPRPTGIAPRRTSTTRRNCSNRTTSRRANSKTTRSRSSAPSCNGMAPNSRCASSTNTRSRWR